MTKNVRHSLMMMSLLAATGATAQRKADTVLKGSTIEVVQSYKPRVKQAPKPEWKPQLPAADTSMPRLRYDVPQQTLYYAYNSTPLRPLALGKNLNEQPFANYVKLGAGNVGTIYGDAGIGLIKGKDFESAIHLHHLSQKGSIENQQSSLSGIEATADIRKDTRDWHVGLDAAHNRYHYYGYDHDLYYYAKDAVAQAYTSVKALASVSNVRDTTTRFIYSPEIGVSYYGAKYNTNELTANLRAPLTYQINKELGLHMDVTGAVTSYKADTVTTGNNYIVASPGVKLNTKNFSGYALAGFGVGKNNATWLLPNIEAVFRLPNISMVVTGGWLASIRQNTYAQLTTENPFLMSRYPVRQTKSDEVYLKVVGSGGEHFAYGVKASWLNFLDMATFLNDVGDRKQFYVLYQDVQAIAVQATARYHVANHWSAGVTGEVYSFYSSTDQYVWHQPTTRVAADVMYNITPKLNASAYIYVLGGIRARDVMFNALTLNPATDISLSAEYQIIPRLSAFMQVNNLLNNKYQRWYGYEVYGFNIYGGLRLKF